MFLEIFIFSIAASHLIVRDATKICKDEAN